MLVAMCRVGKVFDLAFKARKTRGGPYADMGFTLLMPDKAEARAKIAAYKAYARDHYDREIQVWTHGHIVIRETEKEAEDFLNYYAVEHANDEQIAAWIKMLGAMAMDNNDPAQFARLHRSWAAGSGQRLVGTADQVAEELQELADMGLDGILWNTVEPERLLDYAGKGLLPRLEAMGVRKPFRPKDRVPAC